MDKSHAYNGKEEVRQSSTPANNDALCSPCRFQTCIFSYIGIPLCSTILNYACILFIPSFYLKNSYVTNLLSSAANIHVYYLKL